MKKRRLLLLLLIVNFHGIGFQGAILKEISERILLWIFQPSMFADERQFQCHFSTVEQLHEMKDTTRGEELPILDEIHCVIPENVFATLSEHRKHELAHRRSFPIKKTSSSKNCN